MRAQVFLKTSRKTCDRSPFQSLFGVEVVTAKLSGSTADRPVAQMRPCAPVRNVARFKNSSKWNPCNFHEWSPPDSDSYDCNNGTEHRSTRGRNAHGRGVVQAYTSCPADIGRNYYNESGGCSEYLAYEFSILGHEMELFELDRKGIVLFFSKDNHVDKLRFPALRIESPNIDCHGSDWGESDIGSWKTTTNARSSRKTSADAAIRLDSAVFSDPSLACYNPLHDPT